MLEVNNNDDQFSVVEPEGAAVHVLRTSSVASSIIIVVIIPSKQWFMLINTTFVVIYIPNYFYQSILFLTGGWFHHIRMLWLAGWLKYMYGLSPHGTD